MKLNFYQRCQGSGEDIKYGRHGQCNNHIHLSEICCLLSPCEIPAQANANLAWSTSGPRAVVNETGVSCCPEVYGELKNKRPVSVVIQQCPNTTYVALLIKQWDRCPRVTQHKAMFTGPAPRNFRDKTLDLISPSPPPPRTLTPGECFIWLHNCCII